jgi:hypothetical protein
MCSIRLVSNRGLASRTAVVTTIIFALFSLLIA